MMTAYREENEAKATFDDEYHCPTPHDYIAAMAKHGYEIGEQARPYCTAAAELLHERTADAWPVHMLDVGCSYGMGSAFVKYGCSFDEMVAFFSSRAPREYQACCDATRIWLNVTPPACDVRTVGLDRSAPAIRFGVTSGLLDGGLARDYEQPGSECTKVEAAWFRSCNMMLSTGAIGYVTERTLSVVLPHLGKNHPGDFGPLIVVTILRMFDPDPIGACFERFGFHFGALTNARLPQRRFTDKAEREKVLALLRDRGIETAEWEDRGKHYADLYLAAPTEQFPDLLERLETVRDRLKKRRFPSGYIRR